MEGKESMLVKLIKDEVAKLLEVVFIREDQYLECISNVVMV